jgi:hypothetical protein
MTAAALGIVALLMCLIIVGSRRLAALTILGAALYLTHGVYLDMAGLRIYGIRMIEVAAIARVIVRGEIPLGSMTTVDRAIVVLYLYSTIVFVLRSSSGYAYAVGMMVDVLATYIAFRSLVKNAEDATVVLRRFATLLLPYTVLVGIESLTRSNPFSAIGGLTFAERGERLRCMGSFRHPSLLGTIGASFLPLYLALLKAGVDKARMRVACSCCLAIVFFANSGGPVSALAAGLLAWLAWPLRGSMRLVRRTLALTLIGLALVMKAPIWYLPAKISNLTGGDGWHRSYLIETAINRVSQWWLMGMDISDTAEWFDYTLAATGSADITNQYLLFGINAGFVAIVLFAALIVAVFNGVGRLMEHAELKAADRYLAWALGCTAVVHISTWMGITYNFDQTYVFWAFSVALVSSLMPVNHLKQAVVEKGPDATLRVQ